MSEQPHFHIALNADGVVAPAQRAVTICSQLLPISLAAVDAADLDNPPQVQGAFWRIDHPPHQDVEAMRGHFRQWLVAKGLQELARGVRGSLEEAATFLWAFDLDGKNISIAEFQAGLADTQRHANSRNFPQLLDEISARLNQPLDFKEEYLSLQRVRSCLEHQDGVVQARHLDRGSDRMTLTMPRFEAWAIDLDPPLRIEGEVLLEQASRIEIRPSRGNLSFEEGQRIVVEPSELLILAQGCLLFAQDLVSKLPQRLLS